ncbi:hypothetical protein PFDSM3638_01060 [Pyrococcus furiosus DSM 3638]|uniref:Uncharacterized protein n=2 Tax=Pyrococcus furiosus TaxID=2261 RepID=A0A5C0XMC2_PYRFU|nr:MULTISPECIES: hypothetical protein [Pyrococcus]AFN03011.1 hypothetical protein PFC_00175 [Pyrococcus furiosus COM1]MDK2869231.1 hypothetical protein [Pyrococcus sp.]QEK77947.1 hypothetical protein PFDSM3638_01060 [Pyrococcus furiosus DSM 3638]
MKKIFEKEGIFVNYKEKVVKTARDDVLIHREENPTRLWWELKEAIKGKKVKIVVYEVEDK